MTNKKDGLIKLIVLIILGIAILSYLGFDLRGFISSEIVQNNFGFIFSFLGNIWHNYLAKPADYLWNDIFLDLIWNSFIENLGRLKSGEPSTLIDN